MAKLVSEVHWSYWIEIPKQALHTVCLCVTERFYCSVSSLILYSFFFIIPAPEGSAELSRLLVDLEPFTLPALQNVKTRVISL